MNTLPKITVVTPSYNQGAYLEETIRSVLDQRYPNLEYIVIDGGSTDQSLDIIRKYASHFQYWVSEKDSGQTEAINKGLRRATGELVTWLNSDDVFTPNALHHVAKAYLEQPADVIYGDYILMTSRGKPFLKRREIPFDYELLLYGVNFIGQPSSYIRRSVFLQHGFLDESMQFSMDYELWLRIGKAGAQFRHIKEFLSYYRYHETSKTVNQAVAFRKELDEVRAKYSSVVETSETLRKKMFRARIRRQWAKLRYRGTVDYFGGPLTRIRYRLADR